MHGLNMFEHWGQYLLPWKGRTCVHLFGRLSPVVCRSRPSPAQHRMRWWEALRLGCLTAAHSHQSYRRKIHTSSAHKVSYTGNTFNKVMLMLVC